MKRRKDTSAGSLGRRIEQIVGCEVSLLALPVRCLLLLLPGLRPWQGKLLWRETIDARARLLFDGIAHGNGGSFGAKVCPGNGHMMADSDAEHAREPSKLRLGFFGKRTAAEKANFLADLLDSLVGCGRHRVLSPKPLRQRDTEHTVDLSENRRSAN